MACTILSIALTLSPPSGPWSLHRMEKMMVRPLTAVRYPLSVCTPARVPVLAKTWPCKAAVLEAVGECAVHPADGEAGAQFRSPGLLGRVDEQAGEGARSDEVLRRKARAIVELEVRRVDSSVDQELVHDARTLREGAVACFQAAEGAKEKLSVEVLADLERDGDVLLEGRRDMRGQNALVVRGRRDGLDGERMQDQRLDDLGAEAFSVGREPVVRPRVAGHGDAARQQHLSKRDGGELGGVLNGEAGVDSVGIHGAEQADDF